MIKKNTNSKEDSKKWERFHEYEDAIVIWRYDSKISQINPYEVEVKYKEEIKKKTNKIKL